MAIPPVRTPILEAPITQPIDFTFTDNQADLEINFDMDLGRRTMSILGRSIYIPPNVTLRAREIQLLVFNAPNPHARIICQGTLVCPVLRINTTDFIGNPPHKENGENSHVIIHDRSGGMQEFENGFPDNILLQNNNLNPVQVAEQ